MIAIIDYGLGNLASIKNMLKRCGVDAIVSSETDVIRKANKFILPGVGSFDQGISNLRSSQYYKVFEEKVLHEKTPVLGVCLGAQLLAESSEEGQFQGLGWIKGKVVKFDKDKISSAKLKVPHMGWTDVKLKRRSLLFESEFIEQRFYFVHSYHWVCADPENELLTATHGYEFTAGVEAGNILGVQFHPEKSHKYGMRLYQNFVKNY